MVNFPKIAGICVSGYSLYPAGEKENLEFSTSAGPSVILGVNGQGKSTLLQLCRFLITGPVRSKDAGFAGERRAELNAFSTNFFAVRVADNASGASASITVEVGTAIIKITRKLSDLKLVEALITASDREHLIQSEEEFRQRFTALMRLERFIDVVGLLDRVSFFLESKKLLLWDRPAQFETFRALLTPELSEKLRQLEGQIISADSSARNLNATLFKITEKRRKALANIENHDTTLAQLASKEGARDRLKTEIEEASNALELLSDSLEDAELQYRKSEATSADLGLQYEKLKFDAVRQSLAGIPTNIQYIFLKGISDKRCSCCGSSEQPSIDELETRTLPSVCPICGSHSTESESSTALSKEKAEKLETLYAKKSAAELETRQASDKLKQVRGQQVRKAAELQEINAALEKNEGQIRRIRKRLPSQDSARHQSDENSIVVFRKQVEEFRAERASYEAEISELLQTLRMKIEAIREELEGKFQRIASTFFAEKVRLVYAPRSARIGQQGTKFDFPAFEVEMTSGATLSEYVRREADQVSLSQRDYLDIIFRMAIIETVSESSATIVVDGPEGAVDAVFAERAGDLFSSAASNFGIDSLLACNVIEGGFLPHVLKGFRSREEKLERILNLLDLGKPTAALAELKPQYMAKLDDLLNEEIEVQS